MSSEEETRSRAGAEADLSAVVKQAEMRRQDGNFCFKKDRFGAAIDAYTEAITLCPNVAVYWTNRALCHMKRNDWSRVEEDSRRALQLDHNSVKAHYMMGLSLLERHEYAEGVKKLEKALDLGRGANPKSYMVEKIWQELAKAKYLEWEHASSQRSWKLQSLKYVSERLETYGLGEKASAFGISSFGQCCLSLSNVYFVHFFIIIILIILCSSFREACEKALEVQYLLDTSQSVITDITTNSYIEQLTTLEQVFGKAGEDDVPTEVPDYLCCNITLDIFRDPVITPSGVTYERAVLLDHLQKVGKFDPITREPLYEHQLISNLAIKEAVHAFLKGHGWAYKMD